MICDYNADVQSQPLSPEDHIPLLQMKYGPTLKEHFAEFAGLDWFQPEVNFIRTIGDLRFASALKFTWECDENAFDQVEVTDVKYKEDASCPPQIDWECTPGCLSTAPCWKEDEVRFDKQYRIGASWCTLLEKVTYGTLEQRFQKSLRAQKKVASINAWNHLVCEAVNNPAQTLNPIEAACYPVHYIDAGSATANAYEVLGQVLAYMKSIYQGNVDFSVFAHRYFELELLMPGNTVHNYSNTGVVTDWGTKTSLVQGGWRKMAPLGGTLWGESIFIAPDTLDLYDQNDSSINHNPFLNEDGTKYYVLIASRRAFLTGVEALSDMKHYPATCDNKYESLEQTFIGYNKIIRPEELFVIAFDVPCVVAPASA